MYISLSAFSFTEVAKALVTAGASLAAISEKKVHNQFKIRKYDQIQYGRGIGSWQAYTGVGPY